MKYETCGPTLLSFFSETFNSEVDSKMQHIKDDRLLKFRPDTLEAVRKEINYDKWEKTSKALDILENWVQIQPHFMKKDFPRDYLERILFNSKGLMERAKEKLDKLCTFKTLMPEFFDTTDVKKNIESLQEFVHVAYLPQLTPKHHRVNFTKVVSENFGASDVFNFYKYVIMIGEYMMKNEYSSGFELVLDCTNVNILSFVTKINLSELRKIVLLIIEGYGLRVKGIHVISASKMVDALISMLKQVLSAKLADRIHIHKTPDTLSEYIPKKIMTSDYGGEEKSLLELSKDWLEVLVSKEFLDYMDVMKKANTNESCRQSYKFNEHYIGMPGSFMALSFD